ncbi:uncharacterized protein LOC114753806 [Neltuma alba]|uniref:uncharacterized protein LOC114753806 n=1 Tax=Neltuma alba TaxID=207710 RepID=UPI0010A45ED5|nr:uncharacterized protein LOC114753806 [Prosopis alba]
MQEGRSEPELEITYSRTCTVDGVTWLLPEMQEDRSEPELGITFSRTSTENENIIGFFQGYVFFSLPHKPKTEIYSNWSYVFTSSSEPSAVTIKVVLYGRK